MLKIDSSSTFPVIGKFYLVPGIVHLFMGRTKWWPIHGPQHEDADDIGFPEQHFHVDSRFLSGRDYRKACNYISSAAFHSTPLSENAYYDIKIGSVEYKARRYQREYDAFPYDKAKWMEKLERKYHGVCIKDSLVCPHRGALMHAITPDEKGTIICPLHGLRWNVNTGHLVQKETP